MTSKTLSKLVDTSSGGWKESKIQGVQYLPLNTDPQERKGTFLVRMAPGSHYPKHRHPAGEELYLLKGEATIGSYSVRAGSFLYSPAASVHDVSTTQGCVFIQILSEPVEIVPEGQTGEIESLADVPTSDLPVPADPVDYDPSLRDLDPEPTG